MITCVTPFNAQYNVSSASKPDMFTHTTTCSVHFPCLLNNTISMLCMASPLDSPVDALATSLPMTCIIIAIDVKM